MQGAQTAAGGLGQMGGMFGQLGMTGQRGLMNQVNAFNQMGQMGRDIQNQMYGAQYDAARQMAQEPWQRMAGLQSMLGMLPRTLSRTSFNPVGSNFDPTRAFMSMFGLENPSWWNAGG